MKKYLFVILSTICLFANTATAQKVKYPLKFFTFRHSRVSAGIGFEISSDKNGHGGSLMYIYRGNSESIEMRNTDSIPYFAFKLVLDFCSPNSILSFSSGINYSDLNFSLASKSIPSYIDEYHISCLDIPAYLKLRFGSRESRSYIFLNLGAIYSIPSSVKRTYTLVSKSEVDKNKTQLTGHNLIPSTMIGLDVYMGQKNEITQTYIDNWRLVFFTKFDYRINSLINSKYENFSSTSLLDYNNYEFKDFRFAVGLSLNFTLH